MPQMSYFSPTCSSRFWQSIVAAHSSLICFDCFRSFGFTIFDNVPFYEACGCKLVNAHGNLLVRFLCPVFFLKMNLSSCQNGWRKYRRVHLAQESLVKSSSLEYHRKTYSIMSLFSNSYMLIHKPNALAMILNFLHDFLFLRISLIKSWTSFVLSASTTGDLETSKVSYFSAKSKSVKASFLKNLVYLNFNTWFDSSSFSSDR